MIFSVENRLYLSRIINTFGSWLTFLAISLYINKNHGTEFLVYNFLIQALPPLFLSDKVSRVVKSHQTFKAYLLFSLIATINVLMLLVSTDLVVIYFYGLINSTLATFMAPISNSIVGHLISKTEVANVHKNLGAINASILSIAPVLGGIVSLYFGKEMLFILDGISFVLAGFIIFSLRGATTLKNEMKNKDKDHEEININVFSFPKSFKISFFIFVGMVILGGVFNALEFGIFKLFNFTDAEVGWILGSWGVGNLICFFAHANKLKKIPTWFLCGLLSFSFVAFCWVPNFYFSCGLFFLAGLSNALLSGRLRGGIQVEIPKGISHLAVWAKVFKYTSLINISCYGGIGLLLRFSEIEMVRYIIIIAAIVFILSLTVDGKSNIGMAKS